MQYRFGDIDIDLDLRVVKRADSAVVLQPRPAALLEFLIANRDRIVAKTEIFETVWAGRAVSDSALNSAVRDIRKALGDTADINSMVRTYYGRGLRFLVREDEHQDWSDSPAAHGRTISPTVAVLPFDNLSPDPELSLLADGMAEDIITKLYKFRDVQVLTRKSSFSVKGADLSLKEISARLGARYILQGSFRLVGTGVRINMQLIEGDLETQIWANLFELTTDNNADQQDAVSTAISTSLVAMLKEFELGLAMSKTFEQLDAWECYTRGNALMAKFDVELQDETIRLFERAIELDPEFAAPYAGLSYMLCNVVDDLEDRDTTEQPIDRRTDARQRAYEMARRAIDLDPRVPFAWVALGRSLHSLGQINNAIAAATKALALNPDLSWAYHILGMAYWLVDRAEEAVEAFDKAIETSPQDANRWLFMGGKACAFVVLGKYDEAITLSRRAQIEPKAGYVAYLGEICALGHLDRRREGLEAIERARLADTSFCFHQVKEDFPLTNTSVCKQIVDGLARAGMKSASEMNLTGSQNQHSIILRD